MNWDLVQESLHKTTEDHTVVLRNFAFILWVMSSWRGEGSIVSKHLEAVLERDQLNQDHIMVLLVLELDCEVVRSVHGQVLLRVDSWEVNLVHQKIQSRLSICKVLSSKLTIFNFWVKLVSLQLAPNDSSESWPVVNFLNEIQPLSKILVKLIVDHLIEFVNSKCSFSTLAYSLILDLVQSSHLLRQDACLVILECFDFIIPLPELLVQDFNLVALG